MSKILQALQHLDNSVVPIVLPASRSNETQVERPLQKTATGTGQPIHSSNLQDEYVDLARRMRLKLRAPATIFIATAGPSIDDAWLAPLAVALMQQNRERVLLIESGSEHSSLSESLGLATGWGLSEAIVSAGGWRERVLATPLQNVSLLPAGQAARPSSTRLADSMTKLAAQWKQEYAWTILSGGSAARIEAAAFAAACDGALLVVSLAATTRDQAISSQKNLESLGGQVIGCIARQL